MFIIMTNSNTFKCDSFSSLNTFIQYITVRCRSIEAALYIVTTWWRPTPLLKSSQATAIHSYKSLFIKIYISSIFLKNKINTHNEKLEHQVEKHQWFSQTTVSFASIRRQIMAEEAHQSLKSDLDMKLFPLKQAGKMKRKKDRLPSSTVGK